MAKLIEIHQDELAQFFREGEKKTEYCQALEEGNILFFPTCPFEFPQSEIDFLLAQKQTEAKNRKNIAYKPQSNTITNFVQSSDEQKEQLLATMRNYSRRVTAFLTQLLAPYERHWRLDYVSFRPFQEHGRKLRTRARNDLLHIDAFPSRPMHGSRILRFFTNINPSEGRRWITSDSFAQLAKTFGGLQGVPFPKASLLSRLLQRSARAVGVPLLQRSPYDTFMLNMHNFLKENQEFQASCHKDHWEFPPGSCWAVFTDQVSHAALSGQYALEQTLLVPRTALVSPELAPVSVLESLAGRPMVGAAVR